MTIPSQASLGLQGENDGLIPTPTSTTQSSPTLQIDSPPQATGTGYSLCPTEQTIPPASDPTWDPMFAESVLSSGGVHFIMGSDATCHSTRDCEWVADLVANAKDIARLMREGFNWTEDNLDRTEGALILKMNRIPPEFGCQGFKYARRYKLVDTDKNRQWQATMWVYTKEEAALASFRFPMISIESIRQASGWNGENLIVYNYNARHMERNCNAIYDDMPLGGWWPWPKNTDAEH